MTPRKITLLTGIFIFSISQLNAQCTTAGPNSPSSSVNNTSIGSVAWGTPTNALTSNNVRTTAGAIILGDKTNFLIATGFNFSIPSTAVICGISVTVEKGGTGLLHLVNDHSVRIVKGGVISGSEHAIDDTWGAPDVTVTYGGSGDLWGATWTPADINSGNFGVAISSSLTGLSVLPTAHIDHVRITVHFDNSLPIELLSFNGTYTGETVSLTWEVASQLNNDFFTIERSTDGKIFETVGTLDAAGNSSEKLIYQLEDTRPVNGIAYYRLKQTDFNGGEFIFEAITVDSRIYETLTMYPNPANDKVTIRFKYDETKTYTLTLFNQSGKQILQFVNIQNGQLVLDDPALQNGLYLVELRTEDEIIATQKLVITP